jgi:hypothetical protein
MSVPQDLPEYVLNWLLQQHSPFSNHPHTFSELSIDDIRSLCDDLIEAHGDILPRFG